jgi:hypothetical protein
VVFPAPPFCDMIANDFMFLCTLESWVTWWYVCHKSCKHVFLLTWMLVS